jgi:hypothetical protein
MLSRHIIGPSGIIMIILIIGYQWAIQMKEPEIGGKTENLPN